MCSILVCHNVHLVFLFVSGRYRLFCVTDQIMSFLSFCYVFTCMSLWYIWSFCVSLCLKVDLVFFASLVILVCLCLLVDLFFVSSSRSVFFVSFCQTFFCVFKVDLTFCVFLVVLVFMFFWQIWSFVFLFYIWSVFVFLLDMIFLCLMTDLVPPTPLLKIIYFQQLYNASAYFLEFYSLNLGK